MIRMGRALLASNVPVSPFISRADNNENFNAGWRLIECGKRMANGYGRGRGQKSKMRRPVVGPGGVIGERVCPKCDAIGISELPCWGAWCVSCRAVFENKSLSDFQRF